MSEDESIVVSTATDFNHRQPSLAERCGASCKRRGANCRFCCSTFCATFCTPGNCCIRGGLQSRALSRLCCPVLFLLLVGSCIGGYVAGFVLDLEPTLRKIITLSLFPGFPIALYLVWSCLDSVAGCIEDFRAHRKQSEARARAAQKQEWLKYIKERQSLEERHRQQLQQGQGNQQQQQHRQ